MWTMNTRAKMPSDPHADLPWFLCSCGLFVTGFRAWLDHMRVGPWPVHRPVAGESVFSLHMHGECPCSAKGDEDATK